MTFRVPIGTSAVVAIDPLNTVKITGTVQLAAASAVAVSSLPAVTIAAGQSVDVGTMPAVELAPGAAVTAAPAPLLAAAPLGWTTAQRDAANALPALLAAHSAIVDAFALTGTTGTAADERVASIVALIQAQVTAVLG